MSAPSPLFILGAPDAEMAAIESLLRECGQSVHYALAATGRRVAPGQPAVTYDGVPEVPPHELIAIEVAGPWGQPQIDHHDGSERASWGPERFLQASSLGQVIERLARMRQLPASWPRRYSGGEQMQWMEYAPDWGWYCMTGGGDEAAIIPQSLVFEAAADHCPAAAIKGLCPGVNPGAFAPFLAESKRRQYFPAMSAEDFARELATSRATLLAAPPCVPLCPPAEWMGGAEQGDTLGDMVAVSPHTGVRAVVRDLRHLEPGTVPAQGSGEYYPAEFLVGIVAAIFEGLGFVCRIRRRDGRLALRSNGHGQGTLAGTRPAEVFLADPAAFGCGPTQPAGQDASYGNPIRGFFGGTLIDQG